MKRLPFAATAAVVGTIALGPAARAEVLKYRCTSPQVGGQQVEPYLEVDTEALKVSFPRGTPPQSATAEVTVGEVSYVTPYGYYEVKIDRRSGQVLTRTTKRIWVENGTCTREK
jgi:hypothetical protein